MKFTIAGKTVEVDDAVLSKALEDKTETLEIKTTDLTVRSKEEEETYNRNKKAEYMAEGVEVAVKAVKRELNLEFTGKDIKDLAAAAKKAGADEAGHTPDKKVEALTKDVELLKESNQKLISEKDEAINGLKTYKKVTTIDTAIEKLIPEKTAYSREDLKTIIKSKMSFDVDESGKIVVKDSDGNIIKNPTTAEAKDAKSILDDFFKTNQHYIGTQQGGGGGDDSKGGGDGTKKGLSVFIKEMQGKNISPSSPEFEKEFEAVKDSIDMEG